jgi:septal ring-binding cell division protein DamX
MDEEGMKDVDDTLSSLWGRLGVRPADTAGEVTGEVKKPVTVPADYRPPVYPVAQVTWQPTVPRDDAPYALAKEAASQGVQPDEAERPPATEEPTWTTAGITPGKIVLVVFVGFCLLLGVGFILLREIKVRHGDTLRGLAITQEVVRKKMTRTLAVTPTVTSTGGNTPITTVVPAKEPIVEQLPVLPRDILTVQPTKEEPEEGLTTQKEE